MGLTEYSRFSHGMAQGFNMQSRGLLSAVWGLAAVFGFQIAGVSPAHADWETVVDFAGGDGVHTYIARVASPTGEILDIYRDSEGVMRGIFSLGDDNRQLEEQSCPTVRVDSQPPRALRESDGPCRVESSKSHFVLGVINDGVVASTLLTQLMNGSKILAWYHVKDRGYREAEFSLRGSMQALMEAMGAGVEVRLQ